jgi:hypothetical protein
MSSAQFWFQAEAACELARVQGGRRFLKRATFG